MVAPVSLKGKGPRWKRWIGVQLRDFGGKCLGDDMTWRGMNVNSFVALLSAGGQG